MTTLETNTLENQAFMKKVYRAFFSPAQYEVKSADREIIARGNNYRIPFDSGELAVTTWGESGPAVLLMHGWRRPRPDDGFRGSLAGGGLSRRGVRPACPWRIGRKDDQHPRDSSHDGFDQGARGKFRSYHRPLFWNVGDLLRPCQP